MALNGSGVAAIDSTGQPVVASTLITATAFNALTADLATMISTCVMKDGQQTITQNIPFNNKKITGLGAATARTDAASIATIQDGTGVNINSGSVGGTADVITLTASPAITAYAEGQMFSFVSTGTNTTNVTVNINSVGAKAIAKNSTAALVAGDIITGTLVTIRYDGTRFRMMNPGGPVLDSTFRISGSSDVTKLLALEVDGLTTGTTRTITVPDRSLTIGPVLAPVQATTSGTSKDFSSIPAGTKRITMTFIGVSTNGTASLAVQIGDSGGVETSGYECGVSTVVNAGATAVDAPTTYFGLVFTMAAAGTYTGRLVMDLHVAATFTWVVSSVVIRTGTTTVFTMAGAKSLSAELDRVRLTTGNGTDTFDAGAVSISYE